MTKVISCACEHEFQDKVYGKYQRLHNKKTKESTGKWRCTVCGNTKG